MSLIWKNGSFHKGEIIQGIPDTRSNRRILLTPVASIEEGNSNRCRNKPMLDTVKVEGEALSSELLEAWWLGSLPPIGRRDVDTTDATRHR